MFGTITLNMVLAILPEILLLVLIGFVLLFDLLWKDAARRSLGWLTVGGLAVILVITTVVTPGIITENLIWGGMIRQDWLAFSFKMIFLFGAAITTLFSMDIDGLGDQGSFYALLLTSTMGMALMASSADVIMLYLSIETTSIPLYVLAGFFKRDDQSTESGFKYFLFGSMTSAVMLYGFSLLFGFTGTTNLYIMAGAIQNGAMNIPMLITSLLLILVGFSFKVSIAPFHFWAPDVYQGAPTPVAGFLSTASKAAGFAVLVRVLLVTFPVLSENWSLMMAIIATITMTIGNVLALTQSNIKRLLAYSSIAHAGYILIGVASLNALGVTAVVFYLIVYLLTNLAAFGIVATFWRVEKSDQIGAYDGMSRRSPWLAIAMLVAFLSLAGMPPFGGFIVKIAVFAAAVQSQLIWLAFVGVLNSIVGLYYYLVVLKHVYLFRSEKDDLSIPITRPYSIALVILTLGIVLIGTLFGPWFTWSTTAAASIF